MKMKGMMTQLMVDTFIEAFYVLSIIGLSLWVMMLKSNCNYYKRIIERHGRKLTYYKMQAKRHRDRFNDVKNAVLFYYYGVKCDSLPDNLRDIADMEI